MDEIQNLANSLWELETKLEALSSEYANISGQYQGESFAEQNHYANILDELIQTATHEYGSAIGFTRQTILELSRYLVFRKTHKEFPSDQLEKIIDDHMLSATEKQTLATLYLDGDNKQILATIEQIKQEWNTIFENRTYYQVKKSLDK